MEEVVVIARINTPSLFLLNVNCTGFLMCPQSLCNKSIPLFPHKPSC